MVFFKFVEVPAPRILSIPNSLSKHELIDKIASNSVKKLPKIALGRLPKFVGEVSDDGFQVVMYLNAKQKILKPTIDIPVNVSGITQDSKTNEIQIEITIVESQMTFLKSTNSLLLIWWPFWTLGTLLAYPFLLKQDGTIFTSSILMPLGVIIVPLLWFGLIKSPERSLDNAQEYLLEYFKA